MSFPEITTLVFAGACGWFSGGFAVFLMRPYDRARRPRMDSSARAKFNYEVNAALDDAFQAVLRGDLPAHEPLTIAVRVDHPGLLLADDRKAAA